MPSNAQSTSSPVKRPALGRRAISSHAVVTTRPPTPKELSSSHTQKAPVHHLGHHHKSRPHVVGGGHHGHHRRNPSFGKNVSKLQKEGNPRHHQREKSAPVSLAGTPGGSDHHVNFALDETGASSMKKTNSSPALRRQNSGIPSKKTVATGRPQSSSGKKKSVGFELADSDYEGEWEDTTQSPENNSRRDSAQINKEVAESSKLLVDPLTFVKRPYPPFPLSRPASLPEPSNTTLTNQEQLTEDENDNRQDNSSQDATSSFLPNYHPQDSSPSSSSIATSPATAKGVKTSPTSRSREGGPVSRTQQKLWLQRTAALNTTSSDSPGGPTSVSAAVDPTIRTSAHNRPGGAGNYDHVRWAVNGDSEAKHVRKAYEKTALELSVVRRFQSPTGNSFGRINFMMKRSNDANALGQIPIPGQAP